MKTDSTKSAKKKPRKKTFDSDKLIVWGIYVLFGPGALLLGLKIDNFFGYALAFLGFIVIFTPLALKLQKKEKKTQTEYRAHISVVNNDIAKYTIKVSKCDPINANVLKTDRRLQTTYKHNPATATYVGATVGGIHMGDWKVEEAYTSSRISGETNKYNLWYKEYNGPNAKNKFESHIIKKIELTEEVKKQAQKIPAVKKYLKGNALVLENPDNARVKELRQLLPYAHTTADSYNVVSIIGDEKALSKDEMTAVYDFLCGK